jgi:hypothetical protein
VRHRATARTSSTGSAAGLLQIDAIDQARCLVNDLCRLGAERNSPFE